MVQRSSLSNILKLITLSSLICITIGSILTVPGLHSSLKICQIAGPVVMTVGGLLLVFITLFWISRQALLHSEGSSLNCKLSIRL